MQHCIGLKIKAVIASLSKRLYETSQKMGRFLPTPNPSQEGNFAFSNASGLPLLTRVFCERREFPSWEGLGVGSPGFEIPITLYTRPNAQAA